MGIIAQTKESELAQSRKKRFLFGAFILSAALNVVAHWVPGPFKSCCNWSLLVWCLFLAPLVAARYEKKQFMQSFFPIATCLGIFGFFCGIVSVGQMIAMIYIGAMLFSYATGETAWLRKKRLNSQWDRLLFLMSTRRAMFLYINTFALFLAVLCVHFNNRSTPVERIYWAILAVLSTIAIWVTPAEVAPKVAPVPAS